MDKKIILINNESLKAIHGESVKVEFKGDIPKDKYWRDRLIDARYDNCVAMKDYANKKQTNKKVINDE
jgi:hypothetical protein